MMLVKITEVHKNVMDEVVGWEKTASVGYSFNGNIIDPNTKSIIKKNEKFIYFSIPYSKRELVQVDYTISLAAHKKDNVYHVTQIFGLEV